MAAERVRLSRDLHIFDDEIAAFDRANALGTRLHTALRTAQRQIADANSRCPLDLDDRQIRVRLDDPAGAEQPGAVLGQADLLGDFVITRRQIDHLPWIRIERLLNRTIANRRKLRGGLAQGLPHQNQAYRGDDSAGAFAREPVKPERFVQHHGCSLPIPLSVQHVPVTSCVTLDLLGTLVRQVGRSHHKTVGLADLVIRNDPLEV